MPDVVLTGDLLPAGAGQPFSDGGPLVDPEVEALVAEWLLGYGSANTRAAYETDLRHWLAFLAGAGAHPISEANRLHVHAWLRAQEAARRSRRPAPGAWPRCRPGTRG